ncbi:Uncharacterised protein [Serratia quinivorans]|nr:Uncharacterised protein [Serratia quinivorans]CAI2113794.1 Uncharacterised protein [Serratia quinivorans]CAI2132353.1 Uncharacterised protein [Serratia quinivorans]
MDDESEKAIDWRGSSLVDLYGDDAVIEERGKKK